MSKHAGHILLAVVALLVALGLIMLVSTGMWSRENDLDAYHSLKRQGTWLALGVVACLLVSRVKLSFWQRMAPWIFLLGCLLLVLCFVPHVGVAKNGAARWINLREFGLSSVQIQPSEFAKLSMVMMLAAWYVRVGEGSRRLFEGYVIPCLIAALPIGLVGLEVDLGAAALMGLTAFALMFAAGANLPALGSTLLAGVGGLYAAITFIPNRALRFTEFLDVLKNPMDHLGTTGMQQVRAMMAFANGSFSGVGIGNGRQKVMGLPYAHTDFIFPMVGEELGLGATLAVVFCYVVILVTGMMIALHAGSRFGKLLGVGVVVLLALQATLNIAVTTTCLPNKGLPLPFVSYGGSNLLFCFIGVGLLLGLHRTAVYPEARPAAPVLRKSRITPRT